MLSLQQSIFKVLTPSGKIAGTAFLLSDDGKVLTCSHVVLSEEAQRRGDGIPATVNLENAVSGELFSANVSVEMWKPWNQGDLAVLKLQCPVPENMAVPKVGLASNSVGQDVITFGYPATGDINGIWGQGLVLGPTQENNQPLMQVRSSELTTGFSGAPVWHPPQDAIVGMVVSLTSPDCMRRLGETAFFTPMEAIQGFLGGSELRVSPAAPTPKDPLVAALEEIIRASRARCIERWQALGVPYDYACQLADDLEVGHWIPGEHRAPVTVLQAPAGSGKSLIAERLLQFTAIQAQADQKAPIPVYVQAGLLQTDLRSHVEQTVVGLGDIRHRGLFVVVDGLDEAGPGRADRLLGEARILCDSLPGTRAVLTSRPLPVFEGIEESIKVPILSDDASRKLVAMFSGREMTVGWRASLPRPVQEAIRYPLFAILVGVLIRDRSVFDPVSTGEMLTSLVERALKRSDLDSNGIRPVLERLGALSIELNSSPVPSGELGATPVVRNAILQSGLVVQRAGTLAFPLPILTQWFAAQCLMAGGVSIYDIVSDPVRLQSWYYPLAIATGVMGHNQATEVLGPIATASPAFAAMVVDEAMASWSNGQERVIPSAQECGRRVYECMSNWAKGLGPLAWLIAPLRADGVRTVGVQVHGHHLRAGWYHGQDRLPPVVVLPIEGFNGSWEWRSAAPAPQPAWAWRWTLDELVDRLTELLKQRMIPVDGTFLQTEHAWNLAVRLAGHGQLSHDPIPLDLIEGHLARLDPGVNVVELGYNRYLYRVDYLRREVERLKSMGSGELVAPWPGPDKSWPEAGGFIWDPYSPDRLLERTRFIFDQALHCYEAVVRQWFPSFSSRLNTFVTLPASLRASLDYDLRNGEPGISWGLEARPQGSSSEVEIEMGERRPEARDQWDKAIRALTNLRPESASWLTSTWHHSILHVFEESPVSEMVYGWLWSDLRKVKWVNGMFGYRH